MVSRRKKPMSVIKGDNLLVSNGLNWTCSLPQMWGELSCRLDLTFDNGEFTLYLVNENEEIISVVEVPIEGIMRQLAEAKDFCMSTEEKVAAGGDGFLPDYTQKDFGTIDWKGVGGSQGEEPDGYPTQP